MKEEEFLEQTKKLCNELDTCIKKYTAPVTATCLCAVCGHFISVQKNMIVVLQDFIENIKFAAWEHRKLHNSENANYILDIIEGKEE